MRKHISPTRKQGLCTTHEVKCFYPLQNNWDVEHKISPSIYNGNQGWEELAAQIPDMCSRWNICGRQDTNGWGNFSSNSHRAFSATIVRLNAWTAYSATPPQTSAHNSSWRLRISCISWRILNFIQDDENSSIVSCHNQGSNLPGRRSQFRPYHPSCKPRKS